MEYKCNKQYWLENVLKKLYKKEQSLEKVKPKNRRRKKLNIPLKYVNSYKTPKVIKYEERNQSVAHCTKRKKRRRLLAKHRTNKQSNQVKDKFWKFVDAFLQSRSFLSRNKNFFLPVIPSDINNNLLRSIGNTLTLRSRVVSRHVCHNSVLPGNYGEGNTLTLRSRNISRHSSNKEVLPRDSEEDGNTLTLRSRNVSRHSYNKEVLPRDSEQDGFLRSVINENGGRKALAQKIFFIIQRARMKKATDIIVKEVLGGRKAKKSF